MPNKSSEHLTECIEHTFFCTINLFTVYNLMSSRSSHLLLILISYAYLLDVCSSHIKVLLTILFLKRSSYKHKLTQLHYQQLRCSLQEKRVDKNLKKFHSKLKSTNLLNVVAQVFSGSTATIVFTVLKIHHQSWIHTAASIELP